jgi:hypothetical protein
MEELYPGEYKLTWMSCCYISCIAYLFYIYIKYVYFATLIKYILELLGTLFCENVSINKIIMRLIKLCM